MNKSSYVNPNLTVANTKYGQGIYAINKIAKGTLLSIFNGEHISTELAKQITIEDSTDSHYITQIDDDIWLLPPEREPADYFNHACDPNAGFSQASPYADNLIAIRDINPGEEVRYHYAFTDMDIPYEFDCNCGSANCSGKFNTNIILDPKFIQKYKDYIAPFYIKRHNLDKS